MEVLSRPEHLADIVRKAASSGVNLIAVAGGDGSINHALAPIMDNDLTMGLIPTGTGNALAHELGVPVNPIEAFEWMFTEAKVRPIDVGVFNGKPFATVATLGLTTKIAQELQSTSKGAFGRLAYVPAIIRALRVTLPFAVDMEAGKEAFHGKAVQIVVAAGRDHGGPFLTTPNAANDDGLLSIYAVRPENNLTFAAYGLALVAGRQTMLRNVWSCEAPSVRISVRKEGRFIVDGDPHRAKVAEISIRPRAIRVLAAG